MPNTCVILCSRLRKVFCGKVVNYRASEGDLRIEYFSKCWQRMPNTCVILCSRLRKVFCGAQTLVGGGDGGQNNINWLILPDAPPIIEQHCQQTLQRKKRSYGHHDHGEMVRTPTKVISGLLSCVNQSLSMFEQVKVSEQLKNTLKIPSLNDWFFTQNYCLF